MGRLGVLAGPVGDDAPGARQDLPRPVARGLP